MQSSICFLHRLWSIPCSVYYILSICLFSWQFQVFLLPHCADWLLKNFLLKKDVSY